MRSRLAEKFEGLAGTLRLVNRVQLREHVLKRRHPNDPPPSRPGQLQSLARRGLRLLALIPEAICPTDKVSSHWPRCLV